MFLDGVLSCMLRSFCLLPSIESINVPTPSLTHIFKRLKHTLKKANLILSPAFLKSFSKVKNNLEIHLQGSYMHLSLFFPSHNLHTRSLFIISVLEDSKKYIDNRRLSVVAKIVGLCPHHAKIICTSSNPEQLEYKSMCVTLAGQ